MMISLQEAAALLQSNDRFLILLHAFPDGDTIGSGYGLCHALRQMGKQANVACAHKIGASFCYLTDGYADQNFVPETLITTDVASLSLLGDDGESYRDKILLAIDHHGTNQAFAAHTLLDASAASNAEIILRLLDEMHHPIDAYLADCIYTGLSTDTGCFKYTNTTADCHKTAARMMEAGAQIDLINQYMFDTKSRPRIEIEKLILESLEFFADGKVAFITVTKAMRQQVGIADGELEGITSIPRQVEGVLVGCTIRETDDGAYKVSVRSRTGVNSAEICAAFGGGGHVGAAGCRFTCSLEEVKSALLNQCLSALEALA